MVFSDVCFNLSKVCVNLFNYLFKPVSEWKSLLEIKHIYMQIKVGIDYQVQGKLYGLRDFSDSIFILIKPVLYNCSSKALFSQIHACYWKRQGLSFAAKNAQATSRMGTSSEWLCLSNSQIIRRSYSQIGYFKWLYQDKNSGCDAYSQRDRRKWCQTGVLNTRQIHTDGCSLWKYFEQWCTNPEDERRGCVG